MTTIQEIEARRQAERSVRGKTNRKNGYAFEYIVMKHEEKSSIHVSHAQGSRTLFDIVATKKDSVHYIVCKKNSYCTPAEKKELDRRIKVLPDFAVVKLAYYESAKKRVYETLKESVKGK